VGISSGNQLLVAVEVVHALLDGMANQRLAKGAKWEVMRARLPVRKS
jgi:hypothetical protein